VKALDRLSIKIRLYRTSLSVTQQEMANTLGLSLRTFQRIETGQSPIDMGIIYKICDSYDIPFFDLVNPDIKAEDLKDAHFYESLDQFTNQGFFEGKSDLLELKDRVIAAVKKDPAKINLVMDIPEFEKSPHHLFVSNLHFSIGNAKARSIASLPDDKYRTMKTYKNPEQLIKAWDICLKYNFPANKLVSEHKIDDLNLKVISYSFFEPNGNIEDPTKNEPIVFGAFELL
tara:strand:- start:65589 stop:66278 length:690 start_codon:yes stop_codon:yes gene_type:complete